MCVNGYKRGDEIPVRIQKQTEKTVVHMCGCGVREVLI